MIPRDPDGWPRHAGTLRGWPNASNRHGPCRFDSPAESKDNGSTAGAEALVLTPSHLRPDWDLYLELVYVIDLDRQTSAYNYVCHFRLDKLPDAKTLESLTQPANRYWLGLDLEPADACITTDAAVLPPIADGMSAEIEYAVLEPLPMPEITRLDDKTEALVFAMNNIHQFVCDTYNVAITQALHSCSAESHLFRELCHLLLSMACCSPERLRLAGAHSGAGNGACRLPGDRHEAIGQLSCFKYGILSGGSRDLISSFLSDYHEAGKAPEARHRTPRTGLDRSSSG